MYIMYFSFVFEYYFNLDLFIRFLFSGENHLSLSHIHYSFGVKDLLTDNVKMTRVF